MFRRGARARCRVGAVTLRHRCAPGFLWNIGGPLPSARARARRPAVLRLRVLGSVELCADDGRDLQSVLAQPKRLALLAYLACASPVGFHRRDRLLSLFWPELDDDHARGALNAAVRFLRREMGNAAIASRGSDEIGIDRSVCWTDVSAFRQAADAARYDEALSLYRGDLLDGFFADAAPAYDEWLERTRAQLRAEAARAARALAEQREREENFTTAVSCARRAVDLSDADERVVRQLLELLERLGDRAGAVLAYEAFERRLASEFQTEPAPETRALIARIRAVTSVADAPTGGARSASMPASAQSLRNWRIERELGRGGMATVYLARDIAHDRYVALKVMRPELVVSAGVERFLREIQITAQLAHPHILPLIDSGARDGVPYLVTPYVAGESLRARLARERALPPHDAVRIATEIAEALDYAHRSDIVHRDIKPENILLADGHAVVADFGIARALVASGASPIPTGEDGAIVGSRRYMSPEQAAGDANVDARADVYSLGCVLFEMLSGEPPEDGSRALAARLKRVPEAPAALRQLLTDCLSPQRERRPASAAQVLRRLNELNAGGQKTPRGARRRRRRFLVATGAGLSAILLAAYIVMPRMHGRWSSVSLLATRQLTNAPGVELDPALSHDGRWIAYAAGTHGHTRIYVRPISGGDAIMVSGESMRLHRWPSWSPDGSQLAFVASVGDRDNMPSRLVVVSASGGSRRVIAENLTNFSTPAWSPDGRAIAYPLFDSIVVADVAGGPPDGISARPRRRASDNATRGSSAWALHSLAWSPDGRRLAYVSGNPGFAFATTAFGNLGPSSIWTVVRDGQRPIRLTAGPFTYGSPVFTPDGRGVLYVSNASGAWDVYHQAIDRAGHPDGEPRRLTTGLNAHGISLSHDGSRLAYTLMNLRSNIYAAPIRPGEVTPPSDVRPVTDENQTIETVDVTPDGGWLVFESDREGRAHIYKMPTAGGELIQLTNDPAEDFAPRWSPDGRWIAFHRREPSKDGLRDAYVMNANGGERTRLTADSMDNAYPSFSPDGKHIVFGRSMVSTLQPDGRWSAAEPDSGGSRWMAATGYREFVQRGDLYAQHKSAPPRLLVSARQLGGQIIAVRTVDGDPATAYVRVIDSTGAKSFYSIPAGGGVPRLVLRLDDTPRRPSRNIFSTDGRHLYFTVTQAESDIWIVSLRR